MINLSNTPITLSSSKGRPRANIDIYSRKACAEFIEEAQSTQGDLQVIEIPACSAPLRDNRMLNPQDRLIIW